MVSPLSLLVVYGWTLHFRPRLSWRHADWCDRDEQVPHPRRTLLRPPPLATALRPQPVLAAPQLRPGRGPGVLVRVVVPLVVREQLAGVQDRPGLLVRGEEEGVEQKGTEGEELGMHGRAACLMRRRGGGGGWSRSSAIRAAVDTPDVMRGRSGQREALVR